MRRKLDVLLTKIATSSLPEDGLRGQITLGSDMWLIVITASRDRPGREFPLALLCPFAINDFDAADAWCEAAMAVLDQNDGQNADALFVALPPPPTSNSTDLATDTLWFRGQSPAPPLQILLQLSSG